MTEQTIKIKKGYRLVNIFSHKVVKVIWTIVISIIGTVIAGYIILKLKWYK
jgi:hypothetical protein